MYLIRYLCRKPVYRTAGSQTQNMSRHCYNKPVTRKLRLLTAVAYPLSRDQSLVFGATVYIIALDGWGPPSPILELAAGPAPGKKSLPRKSCAVASLPLRSFFFFPPFPQRAESATTLPPSRWLEIFLKPATTKLSFTFFFPSLPIHLSTPSFFLLRRSRFFDQQLSKCLLLSSRRSWACR